VIDMIELLGDGDDAFTTSVVLTYEFDVALYDGLVRRTLNRAGVRNQIVFCDLRTYTQHVTAEHGARFLGRQYSVTPVYQQTGAFHPKVYLLLGDERGRLLVGSGNATIGGLTRNTEVFGSFEYADEGGSRPHRAFVDIAEYVRELVLWAPDPVQRQWQLAQKHASWLTRPSVDDGRRLVVSGPRRQSLIDQLRGLVPEPVDQVTVCSASFDRRLEGLRRLADMSRAPVRCVLQSDRVGLDGKEIQRLGDRVQWREFRDPHPTKGLKRDVRAHAKLMLFANGDTETNVYGSANTSEPALNGTNTEVVVLLPPAPRDDLAARLRLEQSIDGPSIADTLAAHSWPAPEPDPIAHVPCLLIGCVPAQEGFRLQVVHGRDVPPNVWLRVSGLEGLQVPSAMPVMKDESGWLASGVGVASGGAQFVWLENHAGHQVSNAVAVTYADTVPTGRTRAVADQIANAMLGLIDGQVLGDVLFELLNSVPDFEMYHSGSGGATSEDAHTDASTEEERPTSFFYSDTPPDRQSSGPWRGDRVDSDILATLIHPITPARHLVPEDAEPDEVLNEEAEQRAIEEKGDKADGREVLEEKGRTGEDLRKAALRLERRLLRAAASIEASLDRLSQGVEIPARSIARQVWMIHLSAFMAGRTMVAADGERVVTLSPVVFAEYLLRVSRALVGSRRGAFLDKIPSPFWNGDDGATLRRGLGLLWTGAVWATDYVIAHSDGETNPGRPKSVATACPELVAGRLAAKLQRLGVTPDVDDLERRFPARLAADMARLSQVEQKVFAIAALVGSAETQDAPVVKTSPNGLRGLAPGVAVCGTRLGVTVLDRVESDNRCWVIDLSRSGHRAAKYHDAFRPVISEGKVMQLWYRPSGK
jgi:hypothetical protein